MLSGAKDLALGLYVEGPKQGEMLRCAQHDSPGGFFRSLLRPGLRSFARSAGSLHQQTSDTRH